MRKKASKKKKVSEKSVETIILKYLSILPATFAWKNNSTGIFDPKRGVFRKSKNQYAINGVSDILGIHNGRLLAIEVKAPDDKKGASEDQQKFIDRVIKEGGIAGVARSVADVRQILAKADSEGGV